MNRQELKTMFLNMAPNTVVRKEIIVQQDCGHVEIVSDGPDGYSSFKTNQGENALQYALDRIEESVGEYKDLTDHKLIIK